MHNNLISNRQIRVFISSTFHDMQEERDFLIHKIFPKLKDYCSRRDVLFSEIDLRWGITAEESESKKVTEICLREIDNTHPFIIGLLGNRYGWIPTMDDIAANRDLINNYPWLKKDIANQLSLTEIEMRYSALRSKEKVNALFFIRSSENTNYDKNGESEKSKQKLENLKSDIIAQNRYSVSHYQDLDTLGVLVEKQFIELIDSLFPEVMLSQYEKTKLIQNSFIRSRTQVYVNNNCSTERLNDFMSGPGNKLLVTGERGLGKSTLLANWTLSATNGQYHIIPYFISNVTVDANPVLVLDYINETIRSKFDSPEFDFLKQSDSLLFVKKQNCEKALDMLHSKGEKIILLIDGLDQLSVTEDFAKINWLPKISGKNKIIVSVAQNNGAILYLNELGYDKMIISPMNVADRENCIIQILAQHGKRLTAKQATLIANNELCASPLILTSLLHEIISFGVYERLDERLDFYLSAQSENEFFQKILASMEQTFGEAYMIKVFSAILVSLRGLSASELQEIFEISPLEWGYFYHAAKHFLTETNGMLSFYHNIFKEAVEERYDGKGIKIENENCDETLYSSDYIYGCFFKQLIRWQKIEPKWPWTSIDTKPVLIKQNEERYIENYFHKVEELLYCFTNEEPYDEEEIFYVRIENKINAIIDDQEAYFYLLKNNPDLLWEAHHPSNYISQRRMQPEDFENKDDYYKCRKKEIIQKIQNVPAESRIEYCLYQIKYYKNEGIHWLYYFVCQYTMQFLRKKLQKNLTDFQSLEIYIDILLEYGRYHFLYSHHQKAKEIYLKSAKLIDRFENENSDKYYDYMFKIDWYFGEYYCAIRKLDKSQRYFKKALSIYKKQSSLSYYTNMNYAGLLINYARLEITKNNINKSLKLLEKSRHNMYNYATSQYDEIKYCHLNNLCQTVYCHILLNNSLKVIEICDMIIELYWNYHIRKNLEYRHDIYGSMVKDVLLLASFSQNHPISTCKLIKKIKKIDSRKDDDITNRYCTKINQYLGYYSKINAYEKEIINGNYKDLIHYFQNQNELYGYDEFYLALAFLRSNITIDKAVNAFSKIIESKPNPKLLHASIANLLTCMLVQKQFVNFENYYNSLSDNIKQDMNIQEVYRIYSSWHSNNPKEKKSFFSQIFSKKEQPKELVLDQPLGYLPSN